MTDALIQSHKTEPLHRTSQPQTTQRLAHPRQTWEVSVLGEVMMVAPRAACAAQPMPTCQRGEKGRDDFFRVMVGENCMDRGMLRKNDSIPEV